MPDVVAELAERGRALSPDDRARLVELLLATLDESTSSQVDESWRLELRRRIDAHERGESLLHDADDVLAEARLIAP